MKSKYFIIFFFILISGISLFAGQDIKVISSDSKSLVLEFTPQYTDTSAVTISNQIFRRIMFSGAELANPNDFGMPSLLAKSFTVGVPGEFGNTVQVAGSDYTEIQGRLAPVDKPVMKGGLISSAGSVSEKYNSFRMEDLVSFGNFGMAREIPVQNLSIYPVQFDPSKNTIRIYKRIVLRISFGQPKAGLAKNPADDDLLKETILNYQVARNWSQSRPRQLNKSVINSVLSQGKWFRFEAPQEGIYKITAATLKDQGLNPASIDPKTIKIFNNGGKALPEALSARVPDDLVENAVYLYKAQDDGKFNDGDYILFYGRGTHFWDFDTSSHKVVRYYHPYSTANYYWLTFGQGQSKRMQEVPSLKQNPDFVQSTTKAFASWEEDRYKLMNSGRLYVGDDFTEINNSRTYMTNLSGLVSGSPVVYRFNFVNRSEYSAVVSLQENSTPLFSTYIGGVGVGQLYEPEAEYYAVSQVYSSTFRSALPDDRSMLKFTYRPQAGSQSSGYLNYFEIYYDKQLKAFSDALTFYSKDTTGVDEFRINGFSSSDIKVFDVSDYANLKLISEPAISGGDYTFRAQAEAKKISKYIALTPAAYQSPGKFTEIGNSNVHAASEAKFIIITHKNFLDEANRLKTFKESQARFKISTVVVDVDQIFNEFSGGVKDVSAIRNFVRYAYDNWSVKPEYVLLFGDGDYDYKDIQKMGQNFIIPYESYESFKYMESYVSDDYYATVAGNDNFLDLAIGRINVTTASEAKAAVDKIIKYETQSDLGIWRNLITLVADDQQMSDGPDYAPHALQSENLSTQDIPATFDQNKIYLEFYPTVATGTGKRKPAVNQAIIKAINDGTLILNWIGHGNPEVWAHEYVFEKSVTIPQLVNDKYFFLVAATCDFGRFDEPGVQSSTELMLLKPDGGLIGGLSAARTVYSSDNGELAYEFYSNLFKTDSTGNILPVGKSYYASKIHRGSRTLTNDLKFYLSGDPTLRLLVPVKTASVDSVNHKAASADIQVKALSKTKIDGSVQRPDGSIDNSFNGEGIVSVYDSQRLVKMKEYGNYPAVYQGGLLFRGTVSVTNGRFSTEFLVPKDISYENKNGKVVAYLYNSSSDNVIGYTKNIIVGGSDSTAVNDKKGPQIDITLDDAQNNSAYLVKPDFTLNVKLKDESGLNTTGTGIGHKITGVLNGNEASPIDLSSYFVGDLNAGGKSGAIKYKFNGLESGDYKIQVRAWDVFNNSSEADEHFTVVSGSDMVVQDVLNYPNPFSSNTTFTFQRNMTDPVDVKIKVYTVAGRMIKEIQGNSITDRFVRIDWDGRDNDGNFLANGVYLYKVIIKSTDDKHRQEVLGKLAVIR